jgi:hypothetical protein
MKLLVDNYTFNPVAKTVTFNEYTTLSHASLLLITNVTVGVMIYNFAKAAQVVTITGNVVNLNASIDTTGMSATDDLQIFYEDATSNSASDESVILLRRIAKLLEPMATQDAQQRQRIAIDSSTLTLITAPQSFAGIDFRFSIADWAKTNYNTGIRANLT